MQENLWCTLASHTLASCTIRYTGTQVSAVTKSTRKTTATVSHYMLYHASSMHTWHARFWPNNTQAGSDAGCQAGYKESSSIATCPLHILSKIWRSSGNTRDSQVLPARSSAPANPFEHSLSTTLPGCRGSVFDWLSVEGGSVCLCFCCS